MSRVEKALAAPCRRWLWRSWNLGEWREVPVVASFATLYVQFGGTGSGGVIAKQGGRRVEGVEHGEIRAV